MTAGRRRSLRPQLSKSLICDSARSVPRWRYPICRGPYMLRASLRLACRLKWALPIWAFQIVRRCFSPPGAKPSSTPAVVFRPHYVRVYCRRGVEKSSSEPGITVMNFWMYFGFVSGILFDGRIITRKTRNSHRNTENKKNRLDGTHIIPSPVPHTEPTEINGIHEKGDRGGGMEALLFFISGCGG